jgi:hypothetical protein
MIDDPKTSTDEAHMFEPHFDRHVWIYRDNPSGVFSPFNPSVTALTTGAYGIITTRTRRIADDRTAHVSCAP